MNPEQARERFTVILRSLTRLAMEVSEQMAATRPPAQSTAPRSRVMTRERAELVLFAMAMPDEMVPTMARAACWICPSLDGLARENPHTIEMVRRGEIPLWEPSDVPAELPENVVRLDDRRSKQ
jgi:hypothetical protein